MDDCHRGERTRRIVIEAELSDLSHAELCTRHGISRPTDYKWIRRYQAEALAWLEDRSHRPHSCPQATADEVTERILAIGDKQAWAARKIQKKLVEWLGKERAPSKDTVQRIMHRNGRIQTCKPKRRRTQPGPPLPIKPEPNATWTADFKGEFRTQDRRLCYPLTVQDGHSRFLLECRAMTRLSCDSTIRSFTRLFRKYGLPERIRTDNGHPFASRAGRALSSLDLVDLARHHARADSARKTTAERPP